MIPCYVKTAKQAELLDETLHTVAAQTCLDYEIVLVDDGSPLDVAAMAAPHARAVTLRQANAGSAVARNTGIASSRGRFLVFLDADDHLLPRALEAGLNALREHPECGFVVGRREEMTYEGGDVAWGVPRMPRETWLYETLLSFDWYIIPPSSAMFRRAVVDAVGGFRDPWGADDLDFYLRVAYSYPGWCYEEPAVTRYRRYSASSSRDGERMLHSIRAVYDRQRELVRGNPAAEAAFHRGLTRLTEIFTDCLAENFVDAMRARNWRRVLRTGFLYAREKSHPGRSATRRGRSKEAAVSGS
ncbi:MAG: glycosyltransferase family 2 protein [Gemmatimonadetes bacterium]|nr:glycosyltransferase family 2 protein [Gemmatimonadota bacterium]